MTFSELKIFILSDFRRIEFVRAGNRNGYGSNLKKVLTFFSALICNEGFMFLFWFRIGSYLKSKRNLFAKILYVFVGFVNMLNRRLTGIQVPVGTNIGPGLMFNHFGSIVVAGTTTIGANCTIFQGVTIGRTWKDGSTPPHCWG